MTTLRELLVVQEEIGNEIVRIHTNSKKAPLDRRTPEFIKTNISKLQALFNEAKSKNSEIEKLEDKENDYFKKNYFEQIKTAYDNAISYLTQLTNSLAEEESAELTEQRLRVRKFVIKLNRLRQQISYANDLLEEEAEKSNYKTKADQLINYWNETIQAHDEALIYETNINTPWTDEFTKTSDDYDSVILKLNAKIANYDDGEYKRKIKLPEIKIPTFDGQYENWPTFAELFKKIVHENKQISQVEKLQYLKTHLTGDASKIVQQISITSDNYTIAWEILRKRFENTRLTVTKMLDRLIDIQKIAEPSATKLKNLHDTVIECTDIIQNLHINTDNWGPFLSRLITRKWDSETNTIYEQSLDDPHELQDYNDLIRFLEKRFLSLENALGYDNVPYEKTTFKNSKKATQVCKYCTQPHPIYQCVTFKLLQPGERIKFVKNQKLCLRCLNHETTNKCYSTFNCRVCNMGHNTLLHDPSIEKTSLSKKRENINTNLVNNNRQAVILATALINIKTADGHCELFRALIDQGSQASLITERGAQILGLPRQRSNAAIFGVAEEVPRSSSSKIVCTILPRFSNGYVLETELHVLPKLTSNMPHKDFEHNGTDWQNCILADPTFNTAGPVDIILGAAEISSIVLDGLKKSKSGLMAQNTKLGWIVSGVITQSTNQKYNSATLTTTLDEDQQLTKFWETEELQEPSGRTAADEYCETLFQSTTTRNSNGKYVVKLPLREADCELGASRARAVARLLQLEKRLAKNHTLRAQYADFLHEYESLGHMIKVPWPEHGNGKYYIPHQAVIKEDSSSTKLRVVFDASCKTSNGRSLNDIMYNGPKLQNDLSCVLLRWRRHDIAFIADIEKMYRQIYVQNDDQHYQRILWRDSPTDPITEYQLTTVTYGTASAPYLAIRTLQQLAIDHEKDHPDISKIIKSDFYVDDLLSGAQTLTDALTLHEKITKVLENGGFKLRKWISNNQEFMSQLRQKSDDELWIELLTSETKKSLGVHWSPKEDVFQFKVALNNHKEWTKRKVISEIARLFDPLGWIAPVIIKAKLLIQRLWQNNLQWDQNIPDEILDQWIQYHSQLPLISQTKIPRKLQWSLKTHELHGFCDASEKAYGAVVYYRSISTCGKVTISILAAKSKVAPIKGRTTLPRLELNAALLLAKLMSTISDSLQNDIVQYAWSDSMIALAWIQGDHTKWKTFVANRVASIQRLSDPRIWHHVKSKENPADLISRGTTALELVQAAIWWQGPEWLSNPHWQITQQEQLTTDDEARIVVLHTTTRENSQLLPDRFSSFNHMIRVISYCVRFANKCKKVKIPSGALTVNELSQTTNKIIIETQIEYFSNERQQLALKKQVAKNSKIISLSPILDSDSLLRVGGRLANSWLSYNQKHPILLPYEGQLTYLIIKAAHIKTLHGGITATLAYIRQTYWIIGGRRRISTIIKHCVKCIRLKSQTAAQQMGNLPSARVTPSLPFIHTGVDYAGPLQIRTTKGRGFKSYKGYIAVFVCLSTKAVHLEVVSDLTTDAFLAAFKRFTSRRGNCKHLYSDNGTNFVGANNILMESRQMTTTLQERTAMEGTTWHFIPPASPHFGGLWEAAVKSMKFHLKRVVGDATLTYEELSTVMNQIEACMNSRPLCQVQNDNESIILTPGHILIGRPLLAPPDVLDTDIHVSSSHRWQLLQKMKRDFWKSWTNEYLQQLQKRHKWTEHQENIAIGDVVLIKEQNIDPYNWPLARVTEVHPGKDGAVRVVSLRKAPGTILKRIVHQLIPLPVNPREETKLTAVRSKPTISLKTIALVIMCLLLPRTSSQPFTISYPKGGWYIEQLGHINVDMGHLRIEINHPISKLNNSIHSTAWTLFEIQKMCSDIKLKDPSSHCDGLMLHLNGQHNHMIDIFNATLHISRVTRGVLGTLMTSLFGVNDEVYRDIDALNSNQHVLMKTTSQQNKLMLSTLATLNRTDARLTGKLNELTTTLIRELAAKEKLEASLNETTLNSMMTQFTNIYLLASNYLLDVTSFCERLLNLKYNQGSLFEIISFNEVMALLSTAEQKLPSYLQICKTQILDTKFATSKVNYVIHAYFAIMERREYELIHPHPLPQKIEHGVYWQASSSDQLLAVNYHNQRAFHLSWSEYNRCITYGELRLVCAPVAIQRLDMQTNCIIDEIYGHDNSSHCPVSHYKIKGCIWKQLRAPNSWHFIVDQTTRIQVICSGIRQETHINGSGIIQIRDDCAIETQDLILTSHRTMKETMAMGWFKAVNISFKGHSSTTTPRPIQIMKLNSAYDRISLEEEKLSEQLSDVTWKKVRSHSTMSALVALAIVGAFLMCCWCSYWKIRSLTLEPITSEQETVILRPLVSPPP